MTVLTDGANQGRQSARQGLDSYQAALPVSLIATKRTQFVTCSPGETLGDVRRRNVEGAFDYLPVVDNDQVVGVLDVQVHSNALDGAFVREHFDLIAEEFLVGADASILEFVQQADHKPFRLLVTGQGISGLVSLSDVQQLPVRAALFAMITQLEITLSALIRASLSEEAWMELLSTERRGKVQAEIDKARHESNQVEMLLYTQFGDKTRIVRYLLRDVARGYSIGEFECAFREFRKLRDDLAHANDIATSREGAQRVSRLSRSMGIWLERLEQLLPSQQDLDQ